MRHVRRGRPSSFLAQHSENTAQSVLLFEALDQTRRHADLALAYTEAWERGPAWQDGIRFGVGMFSETEKERLVDSLRIGGQQIGEVVTMPFS
ncbi:hypothetical protein J2T08_001787 [Neorhizobium galegae]|uniref:hypothetical protein n=1 Tax=Neorhizobium galegae TaxID=399 RepID=UPI002786658F|nr:hypothetical protein [Neorhizobium galegae]MDQ0133869.1 hypothetical protein [Neorhizobium galegae]